jgi:DNA polymerase-3 subunit alpha
MFGTEELAELAPPKPRSRNRDDKRGTLEWEKETLGLYVSDHRASSTVQVKEAH